MILDTRKGCFVQMLITVSTLYILYILSLYSVEYMAQDVHYIENSINCEKFLQLKDKVYYKLIFNNYPPIQRIVLNDTKCVDAIIGKDINKGYPKILANIPTNILEKYLVNMTIETKALILVNSVDRHTIYILIKSIEEFFRKHFPLSKLYTVNSILTDASVPYKYDILTFSRYRVRLMERS